LAKALARRFVCRSGAANNCAERRFVIEPADYRAGRALGRLRTEITKKNNDWLAKGSKEGGFDV
jgi:hypothetical protein